jgi:uncharacterized protein YutE (UPF0331/DUF86 family)
MNLDIQKINDQRNYLKKSIEVLEKSAIMEDGCAAVRKFAAERAIHLAVESIVDIGTTLIDGLMLRDPGSYLDVITILASEGIISTMLSVGLGDLILLRHQLVREYSRVSEAVWERKEAPALFLRFLDEIDLYFRSSEADCKAEGWMYGGK